MPDIFAHRYIRALIALVEKPYLIVPLIAYMGWALGLFVIIGQVTTIPLEILFFVAITFWHVSVR